MRKNQAEASDEYNMAQRRTIDIGVRIGRLTVEAATAQRKNGYTIWQCRCECGNTILLDTRALQRETIQDCGCITKVKPGMRDLSGQRFGWLVCLKPSEERSRNGSVKWICRCDCGRQCAVSAQHLTSGNNKSCGCMGHPPLKDFIGRKFGKLTVVEYAGKKSGMHRWRCQCDCGQESIVGQTLLQSGKTQSCGCRQMSTLQENLKLCEGTSVTMLESTQRRLIASNTSGYTGVYKDKRGKWHAQITFKGKTYALGTYAKIEDAVRARRHGEEMHENFIKWYYENHADKNSSDKNGSTAADAALSIDHKRRGKCRYGGEAV